MKSAIRSILFGSAVMAVPQFASAAILMGLHDFDGTANSQNVYADPVPGDVTNNFAMTGFSGAVTKTVASNDSIGCTDGFFGGGNNAAYIYTYKSFTNDLLHNSDVPGGQRDAGTDGSLQINGSAPAVVSVSNTSGSVYTLTGLYFDAAKLVAAIQTGDINYRVYTIGDAPGSYSLLTKYAPGEKSFVTSQDYLDIDKGILAVLGNNQTIDFQFTAPSGADFRIDNIGVAGSVGDLTAVPEPGSLVALGCLVGSGAFLRSRRRNVRL